MPFPPTCQSPVTCDNRPIRKIGNTWLCLACFEYTERHNHLPIPEETMSEPIHDQIRAYVQKHGPTHMKQLSAALNIGMSSISSAAATLRRAGHITPASGDGVIRLTPAPADSALPDAAPDEDTVQTSEADVLRAEIDRLTERLSSAVEESMQRAKDLEITREKLRKCQHYSATADSVMGQMRRAAQKERAEIIDALGMDRDNLPEMVDELFPGALANLRSEVARLTESLATLRGVLDAQGLSTNPAELGNELDNIRASMLKSSSDNRELRAERSRCSAVRLEWSPWQEAESGVDTHLWLRIGQIEASIVHIESDLGIKATLFYSDEIGGTTAQIRGMKPEDVAAPLSVLLTAAGLTMPPIPALPEFA